MDIATTPYKYKILFLIPSLTRAGAETQLVDLINGLEAENFEKSLVIFHENSDQHIRIKDKKVSFYQLPRVSRYDVRVILKLASLVRQKQPDIIHCSNQFTMLLAWAALRLTNLKPKLLVTLHTTKNIHIKSEVLERTIYRWVMRRFDRVIFVCAAQATHWERKYREIRGKSVVVYNGVDTEHYDSSNAKAAAAALRIQLGIRPDEVVIACIAAFRREKAHDVLINAFAQLKSEAHLLLAGEGTLRTEIEGQVQRLGLHDRVHFLGNLEDIRPVLEAAQLTVLSSTAVETFSIAMLESMSMGTPLLATDVGGLREAVIPQQTGFLIAAGDVEAMRDSLVQAVSDKGRLIKMGATARSLVVDKFCTAKMVERTQAVLLGVVDQRQD